MHKDYIKLTLEMLYNIDDNTLSELSKTTPGIFSIVPIGNADNLLDLIDATSKAAGELISEEVGIAKVCGVNATLQCVGIVNEEESREGHYVVTGEDGKIRVSSDGVNWTLRDAEKKNKENQ